MGPSAWPLWLQVPCCLCVASVWPFSTESCSDSSHAPITNCDCSLCKSIISRHCNTHKPPVLSISLSVSFPGELGVPHLFLRSSFIFPLFLLTSLKPLLPPSTPSVSSVSLRLLSRSLLRRSALSQNFALYSSLKGSWAVCWISICNMFAEEFLERLRHSARCESSTVSIPRAAHYTKNVLSSVHADNILQYVWQGVWPIWSPPMETLRTEVSN